MATESDLLDRQTGKPQRAPRDMSEVEEANRRAGYHFFDTDTLHFFSSKVDWHLYGGRYFVTSERFVSYHPTYHSEPRKYTVRESLPGGACETVGEFQAYATLRAARRAAQDLAGL